MTEIILAFPTHIYRLDESGFLPVLLPVAHDSVRGMSCRSDLYPAIMGPNLNEVEQYQPFLAYVAGEVNEILVNEGYNLDGCAAFFESVWVQEHHRHSMMESHVHPAAHMVGFYFLNVPEGSSAVKFSDPRAGKEMFSLPEAHVSDLTYASNAIYIEPKEGLLLLAPAWLAHSFTPHGSDIPFRFLHLNIRIQPQAVSFPEVI